MQKLFFATSTLALVSGAAFAQVRGPLEDGFYAQGGIEAEHLSYDGEETTGGYLDLTVGIATGTIFGLPLGVEFGAEGFSDEGTQSAFYGSATLDTGFGVIGAGVPRFALDKYIDTPQIGGFRLIEVLDLGLIDGQGASGFYHLVSDDVPYGLSYDYAGENLAVGLTYHEFDDDDTRVAQGVLRYLAGPVEMTVGGEYFEQGELTSKFTTASLEWQSSRFDVGGAYSRLNPELDFSDSFSADEISILADLGLEDLSVEGNVETAKLWLTWRPIDRLDLTASYLTLSGSDTEFYGLSARYNIAGAFVEAGAVDGIGNETLMQASVGFDF